MSEVSEVSGPTITIRRARPDDREFVFRINNTPEARRASRSADPIPWDDHIAWYERRLADPNVWLWIIEQRDNPVGVVRIERGEGENVISIALAQDAQGRGVGSAAIRLACDRFYAESGEGAVLAYIKPENGRSLRAFERAGFTRKGEVVEPPPAMFVLELRASGSRGAP